jgi:hypothetical protein
MALTLDLHLPHMPRVMHRHYEIWDSTPTHADVVGDADTLTAALLLYVRTRRVARGHTINLLVADQAFPAASA